MFQPLGRRRKEYLHQRNGIPRQSTSLEQSRCSTSRVKLVKRLTSFLTGNSYIVTSVQKGGVPGFSGCVEHTSAITQLIHDAKKGWKDLTVVWLDLANAYGSIPHQLIYKEALQHYHVDGHIQNIITSDLDGIQLRFTVGDQLTRWQKLEKGIVTGCTV